MSTMVQREYQLISYRGIEYIQKDNYLIPLSDYLLDFHTLSVVNTRCKSVHGGYVDIIIFCSYHLSASSIKVILKTSSLGALKLKMDCESTLDDVYIMGDLYITNLHVTFNQQQIYKYVLKGLFG